MGRTIVVMRRWRYSDRGMVLSYTPEYLRVMKKLKVEEVSSFKHEIIEHKDQWLRDGIPYDQITIKFKKRLTKNVA